MSSSSLELTVPGETVLLRLLNLSRRVNREATAYVALIVIGAGFRFWDLGSRALHHDESLHAYYSWRFAETGEFEHLPLMHGPFQFFGIAFSFLLFGDSDYTARIWAALFGTALIGLPYFLRSRISTFGALAAAALLAFSPTFLYYSRFARGDIYMACWTLGMVICLWRYIEGQERRYLYGLGLLLGLSFATKENTYINVALMLTFLNLWLGSHFWRQMRDELRLGSLASAPVYVVTALFAWLIAATWPFTKRLREGIGLKEWHPAGDALVVLGTLTLPQLAAGVQVPLERLGVSAADLDKVVSRDFLWFGAVDYEQLLAVATIAVMTAGAAFVGLSWNRREWGAVALAFYIPYVLLFTTVFTNGDGFYSGNWGSLDYWIAQQDVRRGDQPDFYYLVLLPANELLALVLAGPALLFYSLRGGPRSWLLTAFAAGILLLFFAGDSIHAELGQANMGLLLPAAAIAFFAALRGDFFERFLAFWAGGSLFAYSAAAEKMPWLSIHVTLPLIILAAYALNRLFAETRTGQFEWSRAAWPAAAGAAGLAALAFAAYGPEGDFWLALRIAAPLAVLATIACLAVLPAVRSRIAGIPGPALVRPAGALLAAAVAGGLLLFNFHTMTTAAYVNGDVPREVLVYTQTSPDVPDLVERIGEAARSSPDGAAIPIIVDNSYSWPWYWYLREYSNVRHVAIGADFDPPDGAIVILAASNEERMRPFQADYGPPVRHTLRWWFPEGENIGGPGYRDIGRESFPAAVKDFAGSLFDGGTWQIWWRYLRDRSPPGEGGDYTGERARCRQCGSADEIAYFPLALEGG